MGYVGATPAAKALTSADITDGIIIDADVKSDAAIAISKTALVGGTGLTLSTNTLNVDASQGGITTVGALNAGSITSGFTSIDVGSGGLTTTGAIAGGTIDATTDFTIGTTVITDDAIAMDAGVITLTPSASDTVTMTAATNGVFSLVTVDAAAAAANIQITADGTVDIDSAGVLTLDSGDAINIEPASGSVILLDGTISIDAGVVTGATSITSTVFEGGAATLSSSSANEPVITLTNTHADATSGILKFNKDPGSGQGADSDVMGTITWYGTDAGNNAPEELARMEAYIIEADDTDETSGLKLYVAENSGDLAVGLSLLGQAEDGEVDVNIGAGAASVTTIAGTLTMGSTAAMTNAGLVSVANQSGITGVGTISSGTWEGTTVAVDQGGTGATSLSNLITMGTHTTGNYVATVTAGTGLTSTGGTSGESIAHSLSVDAAQTGITSLGTQAANVAVGNGYGVVIGTATQETVSIGDGATDLVPELQVLGTAAADSSLLLAAFSTTATTAGSPIIALAKGGNATLGSHTVVTDGEELGNIIAFGDDGTDLESPAASIQFEVDGTPGSNDMPGRILLNTTADGATAVTEAVRIDASQNSTFAGNVILSDASNISIGTPLLAGTDHTTTGITAEMLAGGAIAAFDLVCVHTVTQEVIEADASAYATARVIGIAPVAISDTATGTILLHGFIRDDTWTWTTGSTLYLSETAGAMTHTAPTTDGAFVQVVGVALSPDVVYFNPSRDIIEHA
jgi:hypothetical protein